MAGSTHRNWFLVSLLLGLGTVFGFEALYVASESALETALVFGVATLTTLALEPAAEADVGSRRTRAGGAALLAAFLVPVVELPLWVAVGLAVVGLWLAGVACYRWVATPASDEDDA